MPAPKTENRLSGNAGEDQTRTRMCPICAKPSVLEFRPFCSKRCADIDLHRWLSGVYAVPVAPGSSDEIDREEPEPD